MIKTLHDQERARSLRWRIHSGFDDYVRRSTGDGTVTLSSGVWRDASGCYHFPGIESSSDPANLHFGGSVEFRAYMGVLSLQIADPSLHFSQGAARVCVADAASEGERLELATATFDEGLIGHVELDLRLTERGSELFFGKYPAGTQLACVTVTLPERAALPAEEGLR